MSANRSLSARARFWLMAATVVVTGLILVLVNLLLRGVETLRKDFTEDRRHTLMAASERIVRGLESEVLVTVYMTKAMPALISHLPELVRNLLGEYRALSGGRLSFQFRDPEDDVDVQAETEKLGIKPQPVGEIRNGTQMGQKYCFASLVFRYGEKTVVYDMLTELRDRILSEAALRGSLEYEFATVLKKITGEKRVIGIVSEKIQPPAAPGQQSKATDFLENLRVLLAKSFEIQDVSGLNFGNRVPEAVSTLIVHRPKKLPESAKYEIDQFVMRGGRLIVLLDHTAVELPSRTGRQLQNLKGTPTEPGLLDLLEHWGIRATPSILQDRSNVPVAIPETDPAFPQRVLRTVTKGFVSWIRVPKEQLDPTNTMSSTVGGLTLFAACPLEVVDENLRRSGVSAEILARTSGESWTLDDLAADLDPAKQQVAGSEQWKSFPVAVLLSGRFPSFYRGKDIPKPVGADGQELPNAPPSDRTTIESSAADTRVLVVGDADFIDDTFLLWLRNIYAQQFQGNAGTDAARQNLSFALNAAESFSLGTDVLEIRSRQIRSREVDMSKVDEGTKRWARWLTIGVIPGVVVLFGILRMVIRWVGTTLPAAAATRPHTLKDPDPS